MARIAGLDAQWSGCGVHRQFGASRRLLCCAGQNTLTIYLVAATAENLLSKSMKRHQQAQYMFPCEENLDLGGGISGGQHIEGGTCVGMLIVDTGPTRWLSSGSQVAAWSETKCIKKVCGVLSSYDTCNPN